MAPSSKPQYCISLRIDKQILHNSIDENDEAEFYLVTKLLDRCVGRLKVESEVNPHVASEVSSTNSNIPTTNTHNNRDCKKATSGSPAKQLQKVNVRPTKRTAGVSRSRSRSYTKAAADKTPKTSKAPSNSFTAKTKTQSPQQQSARRTTVPQKRRANSNNSNTWKHGTLKETLHVIEKRSRTRSRAIAKAANLYADKTLRRIKKNKRATPTVTSQANSDKSAASGNECKMESANEHESDHQDLEAEQGSSVLIEEDENAKISEEKNDSKEAIEIDPIDLQTWKLVTGRPKRQSIVPKRFEHSPKKRKLWGSPYVGSGSRKEKPASKKRKQDDEVNANDEREWTAAALMDNREVKSKQNDAAVDESVLELLGVDDITEDKQSGKLVKETAVEKKVSWSNNKQPNDKEGEKDGNDDDVVIDVETIGECAGEEILNELDSSVDSSANGELPSKDEIDWKEQNGEQRNIFEALKESPEEKKPDEDKIREPMRFKSSRKRGSTTRANTAKRGGFNKVNSSVNYRNGNNKITNTKQRRRPKSPQRTTTNVAERETEVVKSGNRSGAENELQLIDQNHNGTSTPQIVETGVVDDNDSLATSSMSFDCKLPHNAMYTSQAHSTEEPFVPPSSSPGCLLLSTFNSSPSSPSARAPSPQSHSVTTTAPQPAQSASGNSTNSGGGGSRRCFLCFDSGHNLIMCAKCPRVFHGHCLIPPLKQMPQGDWFCRICCKGTRLSQS